MCVSVYEEGEKRENGERWGRRVSGQLGCSKIKKMFGGAEKIGAKLSRGLKIRFKKSI